MHQLFARITTAWNTVPVFLQATFLLAGTAYCLLYVGKALGQALYYLTH